MLDLNFLSLISLWIQKDLNPVAETVNEELGGILQVEPEKYLFTETPVHLFSGNVSSEP